MACGLAMYCVNVTWFQTIGPLLEGVPALPASIMAAE
jgi:hypothetical protein